MRNVIPSYRWICQVCDTANAPAVSCCNCGAPVLLSVSEIQLAKTKGVAAVYASREDATRVRLRWIARPLWRKVGDVIFGTMLFAGIFLIRMTWVISWSIRYVAVGCAALLLPFLWIVATRERDESR
jgi:hypothetical protein